MSNYKRRGGFGAGEIRLTVLAGCLAGLVYAAMTAGDARSGESISAAPARQTQGRQDWRIIDGDTFAMGAEKIRIADIDTPEVNGRCSEERALAARATARMEELLGKGPFQLQRVERDEDRYGRKLRVVTRNGRSLGDVLVAEGLARTWSGRREPWCA